MCMVLEFHIHGLHFRRVDARRFPRSPRCCGTYVLSTSDDPSQQECIGGIVTHKKQKWTIASHTETRLNQIFYGTANTCVFKPGDLRCVSPHLVHLHHGLV